ncbi:hypothetical protein GEV33_002905 [Tenebrio molitor]|uniref:Uncharacterized protein n=1 Tax=Tenebrio molitor TaxID=7067 RepID=A0A8J6HQP4_TENMO|nr:hypothetical protein GEV33_002905 [Tenebrio molitor]
MCQCKLCVLCVVLCFCVYAVTTFNVDSYNYALYEGRTFDGRDPMFGFSMALHREGNRGCLREQFESFVAKLLSVTFRTPSVAQMSGLGPPLVEHVLWRLFSAFLAENLSYRKSRVLMLRLFFSGVKYDFMALHHYQYLQCVATSPAAVRGVAKDIILAPMFCKFGTSPGHHHYSKTDAFRRCTTNQIVISSHDEMLSTPTNSNKYVQTRIRDLRNPRRQTSLPFEDGAKAKVANGEDFLLFPGSPRGSAPSELINFSAWLIVGAPEAQSTIQRTVAFGGAVYRCPTDRDGDCEEIGFDTKVRDFLSVFVKEKYGNLGGIHLTTSAE